jgi:hypothetical protein
MDNTEPKTDTEIDADLDATFNPPNLYQPVLPEALCPLEELRDRVQKVRRMMVEGEHYGPPAGREKGKDTLLKAGAELLCAEFRCRPSFRWEMKTTAKGHVAFVVTTTLIHYPSGTPVGQGIGYCTTQEEKYAYRWEKTTQAAPRGSAPPEEGMQARPFGPNGQWVWCRKVENPAIADQINTVFKMSKIRSHRDVTLTCFACSDMFTQDMEDHPDYRPESKTAPAVPAPEPKIDPVADAQEERMKLFEEYEGRIKRCRKTSTLDLVAADIKVNQDRMDQDQLASLRVTYEARQETLRNNEQGEGMF